MGEVTRDGGVGKKAKHTKQMGKAGIQACALTGGSAGELPVRWTWNLTQGKSHEGSQSQQVGQSGRNHTKEEVDGGSKRWKVEGRKVSNSGVDVDT